MSSGTRHKDAELRLDDLERLRTLDPADIDQLPWEEVKGYPGVKQKILWRLGDITQSLVRYEPGTSSPGPAHLAAHHHVWVVSGVATIAGRRLPAGSYAHIPPGIAHPTTDVGPAGCTLLVMYRPHGPQEEGELERERLLAELGRRDPGE